LSRESLSLLLLYEPLSLNLESMSFRHFHLLRLILELFDRFVESRSVLSQPRVTSDIFDRTSLSWFRDEHHVKELTRFIREPFGEDEFGIEDVLVK